MEEDLEVAIFEVALIVEALSQSHGAIRHNIISLKNSTGCVVLRSC